MFWFWRNLCNEVCRINLCLGSKNSTRKEIEKAIEKWSEIKKKDHARSCQRCKDLSKNIDTMIYQALMRFLLEDLKPYGVEFIVDCPVPFP